MTYRMVMAQHQVRPAADGDGVKLKRVFGGANLETFDPFLMMDEFGSAEADDYIGGFPAHPHRGFETITYMLQGRMEHQDHLGNRGLLTDGGVQWMTAGKGIIHSEMPKQTEGLMRGFQIWLNLPAKDKMQIAHYEDVSPAQIPRLTTEQFTVKAIAGFATVNDIAVQGYFSRGDTQPLLLDLQLEPEQQMVIAFPEGHRALLYVYEGQALLGSGGQGKLARKGALSRLTDTGDLLVQNYDKTDCLQSIVLAGKPLGEPIVHFGPFVMNTPQEIEQAIMDYQCGRLTD